MSNDEGTYAPKSPDLSSFFASGGPETAVPTAAQPPNPVAGIGFAPFQAQAQAEAQAQAQAQVQAAAFGQPQPHHAYGHIPAASSETYNEFNSQYPTSPSSSSPHGPGRSQPQPQHFYPPQPLQYGLIPPPAYDIPQHTLSHGPQPYYSALPETQTNHYQQPPPPPQPLHVQPAQLPQIYDLPSTATPVPASAMPPRKAAKMAEQLEIMPSPVKTKFPTARIKRIMQADEEVGKVAQQTPIAVGKALELFMVQIVTKSADVAKDKSSKRITAQMLKQAVEVNPQWDFLQDIVSKVSEKEEPAKAGKAKLESESEEDLVDVEPKKKSRGGRKKKAAS
ncbi:hypothetical protein BJ170DRAFT_328184 [Xylariales sp. AK1849]|nr:hypothetical protein BJ170DRAFT_328184 [Xylariales sp. AK1849]